MLDSKVIIKVSPAVIIMLKLGLSVQTKNIINNPNALFHVTLTHNGEYYNVVRDKSSPNHLALISIATIAEKDWSTFDRITENPTSTLLQDLQIELSRLGVSYQGFTHPLRKFRLIKMISCINIQEDDLVNGIEFLRRAQALTEAIIEKEIERFRLSTSHKEGS